MRAVPSQQTRITLVLLGTGAIGVAITLILWQVQLAASRTALSNRFDEAAHRRFAALQTELKPNLRAVQMLSGLRTSGGQLDPREFAGLAAQALARALQTASRPSREQALARALGLGEEPAPSARARCDRTSLSSRRSRRFE